MNTQSQWDSVRTLSPEIAPHTLVSEQTIRGTLWYVLQNEATGEHARFNKTSYAIISRIDGVRTLDEILLEANVLSYVQCDENILIQLMTRLQRMGTLVGFDFIESTSLRENFSETKRQNRFKRWLNPLAVKVSLLDPDAILDKITPKFGALFSPITLWLWATVLSVATVSVFTHWGDITHEFGTRTLRLETLWWFAVLYPILKLLHELAHALCVKHWGGQVRDVGISLLLLVPVPYVDATDVYASHTRRQRMILTAAGMGVELFLASIALLLWFWVEPGYLKDALFSIFVFGGLTTLLFNANPLLKFDGYYLLQDAVDIPNLGARSSKWMMYKFKRGVFGMESIEKPFVSNSESKWLLLYGIAVAIYRPLLTLMIVVFLWRTYPLLGAVLAVFALINQWLLPLLKSIRWMIQSPEMGEQRSRALALVFCSVCVLTAFLLVPLPSSTRVQGIVAASEQGEVFSEAAGFIETVHVDPGANITEGTPIITLKNPSLIRDLQKIESQLLALNADHVANLKRTSVSNSKDHATTAAEKVRLLSRKQELLRQSSAMVITANQAGTFAPISNELLPGAHIAQGARIGFVVSGDDWTVKTLVPEARAERLRSGVREASVRLAESVDNELSARLIKETPAVTRQLLSAALSQSGGGFIATDPYDTTHRQALKNQFELELSLPEATTAVGLGQRALVRLQHPPQAILSRLWRATRSVWMTRAQA